MTASNDPQFTTTSATPDQCAFCHGPLGPYFYRVGDRPTCATCAAQVHQLQSLNHPTPDNLAAGLGFGLAAAIGSALVWATIQRATGYELGILAWGIGVVVAKAVLYGAQQHRGLKVQIIAMALSALGVVLGKALYLYLVARDRVVADGIEPTIGNVIDLLQDRIRKRPQAFVDPFDLIWLAIALYTAWRLCAPVRIPLAGPFGAGAASAPAIEPAYQPPRPASAQRETFATIALKTGGSMLLSIIVYKWYLGWGFAIGFVFLILIHELGHVIANWHYGIRSSPPIFIPFVGAVIALRQQFPDARVEAISAIAGPVAGTIGAFATLALYFYTGNVLVLELAGFGFMMNLFNLLPLPPLDGGRVMAAVNPWVWILGLVGMGALVVNSLRRGQNVSVLMIMLILALPRVIATLRTPDARANAYYRIHRATSLAIGAAYLALLVVLIGMTWYSKELGAPIFI